MTQQADDMVCLECGVDCANSRARGWIHTDELPKTSKAHDAQPAHRADYERIKRVEAVLTPLNEARAWAMKQRERMQREEMQGVKWSDEARHGVVLFVALEAVEAELLAMTGDARQTD